VYRLATINDWWSVSLDPRFAHLRHGGSYLKKVGYFFVIENFLKRKPKTVLEFGHSSSPLFGLFGEEVEMWGVDEDVDYINAAKTDAFRKEHERAHGAKFVKGLMGSVSELPSDYFDMVCSVSVIEHIPRRQLDDVFKEIHRILKPGGVHVSSYDVFTGQWTKPVLKAQIKAGLEFEGAGVAPLFQWPIETTCFEEGRHILRFYLHDVPDHEKADRAVSNFGTILNCCRKPLLGQKGGSSGLGFLFHDLIWEARWRLFHKKKRSARVARIS
jgi:SAM-dependent methyltransferase